MLILLPESWLLLHPALPSVFLAECSHHQLNITAQCRCVGRGQARLHTLYYLAGNLTVYCGPGDCTALLAGSDLHHCCPGTHCTALPGITQGPHCI